MEPIFYVGWLQNSSFFPRFLLSFEIFTRHISVLFKKNLFDPQASLIILGVSQEQDCGRGHTGERVDGWIIGIKVLPWFDIYEISAQQSNQPDADKTSFFFSPENI